MPTSNTNSLKYIARIINKSGLRYGLYNIFLALFPNSVLLPGTWMLSITNLASKHGITLLRSNNLSSAENTANLQKLGIETLISYGCDHIFKSPLLSSGIKLLNIHPSLLPEYKGIDPLVEQLAQSMDEGSLTLHEITPKIDGGPILHTSTFKFLNKCHLLRLMSCSKNVTPLIESYLERKYAVQYVQPLNSKTSYKSWPSKETMSELYLRGGSLAPKISDLPTLWHFLSK